MRVDVGINVIKGRGMTPEEAATRCINKLVQKADHAPEPIRQQLHAYRDKAEQLIAGYMREAAWGQKMTIYNVLKNNGHPDLAKLIMEL